MGGPVVIRKQGPSPFEVSISAACLVFGVLLLASSGSQTLRAVLPAVEVYILASGLVLGSTSVLAGVFRYVVRSTNRWAIGLEQAGCLLLGLLMLAYAIIIELTIGVRGFTSALFFMALGVGYVWYFLRIGRTVRGLRSSVNKAGGHDNG